jgi:hypothetical protein
MLMAEAESGLAILSVLLLLLLLFLYLRPAQASWLGHGFAWVVQDICESSVAAASAVVRLPVY